MAQGFLSNIEGDVLAEWRKKSRAIIYQTDPDAWLWDVLGKRWWSTQSDIGASFVQNEFTIVKSCNGVGKTQLAGDLVSWFVSVHPPEETSVLLSAPVREQIDTMMFKYLKANYALAESRQQKLIGEITRWPKWITHEPYEIDLVLPKRPADANLVSSFQGVHNTHVAVVLDEAGGLPEDLFIGANAVTTNEHARILAIGNPDKRNTGFHRRFTDTESFSDWKRFTIGANDSPNFTGEMIYPDDLERDAKIKGLLVQVKWANMMRRSALPGVIAAKVDGQFPDEDDNTFFTQDTINKAWETKIDPPDNANKWLGADLSYQGEDQSTMYFNNGGKVRFHDAWNRDTGTEAIQSARRIHNAALELGVSQVRVDMAGTGSGVYSNLKTLDEFKDRPYALIGINGSNSAPDKHMFPNARAWHYYTFRQGMINGHIDLDLEDTDLRDELQIQPYKINNRSQIQILSKQDMRSMGIHSPDHLDAAIYSYIDMSAYTEGVAAGLEPGETVVVDPWELLMISGAGLPI